MKCGWFVSLRIFLYDSSLILNKNNSPITIIITLHWTSSNFSAFKNWNGIYEKMSLRGFLTAIQKISTRIAFKNNLYSQCKKDSERLNNLSKLA